MLSRKKLAAFKKKAFHYQKDNWSGINIKNVKCSVLFLRGLSIIGGFIPFLASVP